MSVVKLFYLLKLMVEGFEPNGNDYPVNSQNETTINLSNFIRRKIWNFERKIKYQSKNMLFVKIQINKTEEPRMRRRNFERWQESRHVQVVPRVRCVGR